MSDPDSKQQPIGPAWLICFYSACVFIFVGASALFALDYAAMEYQNNDLFPRLADESAWVRGEFFGYPWRYTQRYVSHNLFLPWFQDRWLPHLLFSLLLHPLNGLLVSALFLGFIRSSANRIKENPVLTYLGAFLSGLVFTVQGRAHAFDTSTLSYRLVIFFSLCTLILALRCLRKRNMGLWILVCAFQTLALFSHLYAFVLLPFVFLLELACWRGPKEQPRSWTIMGARYLLMLLPLGFFYWVFGQALMDKATESLSQYPTLSLRDSLSLFPWYLRFSLEHMWATQLQLGRYDGIKNLLISLTLLGGCLPAIYTVLRKGGRVGFVGGFFLFLIGWSLVSYPITLGGVGTLEVPRRYAFNAVGVCIGLSYLFILLLAQLGRLIPHKVGQVVPGLIVTALVAFALVQEVVELKPLSLWENLNIPQDGLCPKRPPCPVNSQENAPGGRTNNLEDTPCWAKERRDFSLQAINTHSPEFQTPNHNWIGANFLGSSAVEANFENSVLDHACLIWSQFELGDFRESSLKSTHLGGAYLVGANFEASNLQSANLSRAVVNDGIFRDVDARSANFDSALLQQADFSGADLRNTNFGNADLTYAKLEGVQLEGANMQNAAVCDDNRRALKNTLFQVGPMWVQCAPLH